MHGSRRDTPRVGSTRKAPLDRSAQELEPPQAVCAQPLTVLLVDDEPAVLAVAARMLELRGHRVLVARGGADALELCQQHAAEIDAVITDLLMPEMDGAELLMLLREIRPGLPGVFMSGFPGSVREARVPGAPVPFLQKPFDADALFEIVEAAASDR